MAMLQKEKKTQSIKMQQIAKSARPFGRNPSNSKTRLYYLICSINLLLRQAPQKDKPTISPIFCSLLLRQAPDKNKKEAIAVSGSNPGEWRIETEQPQAAGAEAPHSPARRAIRLQCRPGALAIAVATTASETGGGSGAESVRAESVGAGETGNSGLRQ